VRKKNRFFYELKLPAAPLRRDLRFAPQEIGTDRAKNRSV